MKKKLKVFLALIIIAAIGVGAYFLLNKGAGNKEINVKINNLNNNLIENNVNIYKTTNQTVSEMIVLINNKGYDVPKVLNDFKAIENFIKDYELIKQFVEDNAAFVNNKNTNPYLKNMKRAYSNVTKLYKEGYAYLKDEYLAVTNEEHHNKEYVENFYNIFNGSLKELNDFYVNGGIAFVYALDNTMNVTNKYRLEIEYYCLLLDYFNETYIEQSAQNPEQEESESQSFNVEKFIDNKNLKLFESSSEISNLTFDSYINNKQVFDDLISNKIIDKSLILENYMAGKAQEYINSLIDENQKLMAQNYLTYVIEG